MRIDPAINDGVHIEISFSAAISRLQTFLVYTFRPQMQLQLIKSSSSIRYIINPLSPHSASPLNLITLYREQSRNLEGWRQQCSSRTPTDSSLPRPTDLEPWCCYATRDLLTTVPPGPRWLLGRAEVQRGSCYRKGERLPGLCGFMHVDVSYCIEEFITRILKGRCPVVSLSLRHR